MELIKSEKIYSFLEKELYGYKARLLKNNYSQFHITEKEYLEYIEGEFIDVKGLLVYNLLADLIYSIDKIDKLGIARFMCIKEELNLFLKCIENIKVRKIILSDVVEVCNLTGLKYENIDFILNIDANEYVSEYYMSIYFSEITKTNIFSTFVSYLNMEEDLKVYLAVEELVCLFNNEQFLEIWQLNYGN